MYREIIVDHEIVSAATLGGAILAGGEGGTIEYGRKLGCLALELGSPRLVDINGLPDDGILLCVSVVGSPAAKTRYLEPVYHIRSVEKFIEYTGISVAGLITNANGGTSTVNGWLQSVALGLPVVDAVCNGRNSPTGVYGSMGLHLIPDYESIQIGVGGNPRTNSYIEVLARGSLLRATNMIRQGAVQAEGALAVARNPVSVSYAKANAAVGGIRKAIMLGMELLSKLDDTTAMVDCVCSFLHGYVVARGKVGKFILSTQGGFDSGIVVVGEGKGRCTISFLNQYMTLNKGGERIANFPDLIVILSENNGLPIGSSQLEEGQDVIVIVVPKEELILGAEIDNSTVMEQIQQMTTIGGDMFVSDR